MSPVARFLAWARQRSSPKDLLPLAVGGWLLKSGIEGGNEAFVFIALYLFGLIPAWWADGKGKGGEPGSGPSLPGLPGLPGLPSAPEPSPPEDPPPEEEATP